MIEKMILGEKAEKTDYIELIQETAPYGAKIRCYQPAPLHLIRCNRWMDGRFFHFLAQKRLRQKMKKTAHPPTDCIVSFEKNGGNTLFYLRKVLFSVLILKTMVLSFLQLFHFHDTHAVGSADRGKR